MARSTAAFERVINAALARVPAEMRKAHAALAREGIAEVEARQGVLPKTTVVDGRRGAAEEQVKVGGLIRYEISPVAEIVGEVYAELVRRSPVRTGNYVRHILTFVNGIQFDEAKAGRKIEVYPAGAEVTFINTTPYARKIEGGRRFIGSFGRTDPSRRSGLSVQAPDGVFEITALAMARRFGNQVRISFEYRTHNGADAYRPKRGEGGHLRYPAVTIKVL